MTRKNCLSYWFPRIKAAGLPVPKTTIIRAAGRLDELLDGREPDGYHEFMDELQEAVRDIGFPCFLRTGHTSGKHCWKQTCFVDDENALGSHVYALIEHSELVSFLGLPTDVWVVRELLPTNPVAILRAYGDMPLVREFRVFTCDGHVKCIHPYWPRGAVEDGSPDREVSFEELWRYRWEWQAELESLARQAADAMSGDDWSVDFLQDKNGKWWLTDMALAGDSWHWPECSESIKDSQ